MLPPGHLFDDPSCFEFWTGPYLVYINTYLKRYLPYEISQENPTHRRPRSFAVHTWNTSHDHKPWIHPGMSRSTLYRSIPLASKHGCFAAGVFPFQAVDDFCILFKSNSLITAMTIFRLELVLSRTFSWGRADNSDPQSDHRPYQTTQSYFLSI